MRGKIIKEKCRYTSVPEAKLYKKQKKKRGKIIKRKKSEKMMDEGFSGVGGYQSLSLVESSYYFTRHERSSTKGILYNRGEYSARDN